MAIEITKKQKFNIKIIEIIAGGFSLLLLLAIVGVYFYLDSNTKKIAGKVEEIQKSLEVTPSEQSLEDNVSLIKNRIEIFSNLISKHKNAKNIFALIENDCLPMVQFTSFNFDMNQKSVSLSGITDGFIPLEQQLNVLRKEPLIKKVNLSNMSMESGGTVNFSVSFVVDPKIFK